MAQALSRGETPYPFTNQLPSKSYSFQDSSHMPQRKSPWLKTLGMGRPEISAVSAMLLLPASQFFLPARCEGEWCIALSEKSVECQKYINSN